MKKSTSLIAYAKSIGKVNTSKLSFGDMLKFEDYVQGYKSKKKEGKK